MKFETPIVVPRNKVSDCYFYHTMDLPGLGVVTGDWDLRPCLRDYFGQQDLSGKRVLDVGTATGALSFYAERQGAKVVSFDQSEAAPMNLLPVWSQSLDGIRAMKKSYWLSHGLLKSANQVFYGNIYDLPDDLGKFDLAIMGSILLHLESPVAALRSVAKLASSIVVTEVLLDKCANSEAVFRPHYRPEAPGDDYLCWWYLSPAAIRKMLETFGYKVISQVPLSASSHLHGTIKLIAHVGVKAV